MSGTLFSRFGRISGERENVNVTDGHCLEGCVASETTGVRDMVAHTTSGTFEEVKIDGYGTPVVSHQGHTILYPYADGAELQNIMENLTLNNIEAYEANVSMTATVPNEANQRWLQRDKFAGFNGTFGVCGMGNGNGTTASVGTTGDGLQVVITQTDGGTSTSNVDIDGGTLSSTARVLCVFSSDINGLIAGTVSGTGDDGFDGPVLIHVRRQTTAFEFSVNRAYKTGTVTPNHCIGMIRNDTLLGAKSSGLIYLFSATDGQEATFTYQLALTGHTLVSFLGFAPTETNTYAVWTDAAGNLLATVLEFDDGQQQASVVIGPIPDGQTPQPGTVSVVPLASGPVLVFASVAGGVVSIYRVPIRTNQTCTLVQKRTTAGEHLAGLRAMDYDFEQFIAWQGTSQLTLSWLTMSNNGSVNVQTGGGTWVPANAPPLLPYGLVYGNIMSRLNDGKTTNVSAGVSFQRQVRGMGPTPTPTPQPTKAPTPIPSPHSSKGPAHLQAISAGTSAVLVVLGLLAMLLTLFM